MPDVSAAYVLVKPFANPGTPIPANAEAALPPIPIPLLNAEREATTSPPASPTIAGPRNPAEPRARGATIVSSTPEDPLKSILLLEELSTIVLFIFSSILICASSYSAPLRFASSIADSMPSSVFKNSAILFRFSGVISGPIKSFFLRSSTNDSLKSSTVWIVLCNSISHLVKASLEAS